MVVAMYWMFLYREAIVRSAWIIKTSEDFPRLVSCYVVRGG